MKEFGYQPHIDGLRAFAVAVVFLFHLNPDLFPWGYLGVDVFFVISGFVITQSLYKNYLKTGTINIGQFYLRRFKRLYPALVVMLLGTSIAYFFWGFLWDTNLFIKSSLTSLFAFSNLYYLKQGENYFHQDLINPLLHTWSLGLEEQFYLVYPIVLLLLLYIGKRFTYPVKAIGALLFIATVLLYVIFIFAEGTIWGNYYFPLARFWELLAGCALFFGYLRVGETSLAPVYRKVGIFIFFGVVLTSYMQPSVYFETLGATIATAMLIFAGLYTTRGIVSFISHPWFLYIGALSYSLYLWHMPVIYFSNLYAPGFFYYLTSIVCTGVLAYLSYRFVEVPLRHSSRFDVFVRQGIYALAGFAVAVGIGSMVLGPAAIVKGVNDKLNTFSSSLKEVNYIEKSFALGDRIQGGYVLNGLSTGVHCSEKTKNPQLNELGLREKCLKTKTGENLFYLTGDSHASHLVPMLDYSKAVDDVYFSRFVRQTFVGMGSRGPDTVLEQRRDELAHLSTEYEKIYYINSFHFGPSMNEGKITEADVRKYIETLSPYVQIIFIGPTPIFQTGPQSCVLLGTHCTLERAVDHEYQKEFFRIMKLIDAAYKNVSVFYPYEAICPTAECVLYDHEQDHLYYMDDDHLSAEESERLSTFFDEWFFSIRP